MKILTLTGVFLAAWPTVHARTAPVAYHQDGKAAVRHRDTPNPTCLAPDSIQTGSMHTGLEPGSPGIRPGLSEAPTNSENFINFCSGSPLTNGRQSPNTTCNPIPMGRLPPSTNMISTLITFPLPSTKLAPETAFNVTVKIAHLRAGFLVNPVTNFYSAPQDVDADTHDIIGHCHITIQDLGGSLEPEGPPDASSFVFFKGVDDEGDGKGNLTTSVSGGLPPGAYRVCTIVSAMTHQPVVMPVAQRGGQDDCVRFLVGVVEL